jgi:hypothetical protein
MLNIRGDFGEAIRDLEGVFSIDRTNMTHEAHKKDSRSNVVLEASQVQVCRHACDLRIS